jgi:hypothetical protein
VVPPVVGTPPAPPVGVPPAATSPAEALPPTPPLPPYASTTDDPPSPPAATSLDTWPPWSLPSTRPAQGGVRSTQAANRKVAEMAGRTEVKKRAKCTPHCS